MKVGNRRASSRSRCRVSNVARGWRRVKILGALAGRREMALKIHRLMKEAKDLDHIEAVFMSDPKHDEMTPFAALASDMKREESLGDILAFSCTREGRAGGQGFQCGREGFGICAC